MVAPTVELRQQALDRDFGMTGPKAELHQTRVDNDSMQPRGQSRIPFKTVDAAECRKEGLLQGVGRLVVAAQKPPRRRQHAPAVAMDKLFAGRFFLLAQASHQDGLVTGLVRNFGRPTFDFVTHVGNLERSKASNGNGFA
jgi:hypothetical protein